MNRIFKTTWNIARHQYVVSDEKHASRGKACRTSFAAVFAAAALGLTGTVIAATVPPNISLSSLSENASYVEEGKIGSASSWETDEYKADWGLTAINASSAYAMGYHGQNVTVGVMDSGALMQIHPELAGERFHATHVSGEYGASGYRYPQKTGVKVNEPEKGLPYEKGEKFDVTGNWTADINDTHGTHVTGTVGANRDGNKFHGVAWGSDIVVGNTGATDDNNYGPFQDYDYFYAGWKAIANALVDANGSKRGGVINNSWGTNIRVNNSGTHFPTNTMTQVEYEYLLFKHNYAEKYAGTDHEDRSFVDAAYDAVKGTNIVQIFTTGNRNFDNPYYRPLYPYFNPDAEKHWISVGGLEKGYFDRWYQLWDGVNEAGAAKYWTILAPGKGIYSSGETNGQPDYQTLNGTSMAAPHVAGAMGVLMSRYQDMSAVQVREVLLTTASHSNPNGSDMDGWKNRDNSTPAKGEVSDRMGWGVVDLKKGMYGLGQLTGHFDYNLATTPLDVWSNDISQAALDQRRREDLAWKAAAEKWLKNPTLTLGSEYSAAEKKMIGDIALDTQDDIVGLTAAQERISEKDAMAWRTEYFNKRLDAINAKIEKGLYNGSLTKRGAGMLVLTGNNTYRGGTTVEEGTLWGFNDSFGVAETNARAAANGKVVVNGGSFGILSSYNDAFTQKGEIKDQSNDHSVDIQVKKGGTYLVAAGQDVSVGELSFAEGSYITVSSPDIDILKEAYAGRVQTGSVTANSLKGFSIVTVRPDYAFFNTDLHLDEQTGKLTGSLSYNAKSFAAYGSSDNERQIGAAIGAAKSGALFEQILGATKDQVVRTYDSLGSDSFLNAQNASIINTVALARTIKDQASGIGGTRVAEMADGTARIWATGIGSWGNVDYGQTSLDTEFYAGLIGAELDVCSAAKLGVFFGAGTSEFDAGTNGKLDSDDLHFGAYAATNIKDLVDVNFGIAYTMQDRDGSRALTIGDMTSVTAVKNDAKIAQIFAEAAYKGFNAHAYSIEPYVGFSWMHIADDDFSERVGELKVTTSNKSQNIQMTTLGLRGAVPLAVGSVNMSLKGDVSWLHFFGDTSAEAVLDLNGSGKARIKGGKLDDMLGIGLGIDAQLTKTATFGLSYMGAYDGDVSSSGVYANLRFAF